MVFCYVIVIWSCCLNKLQLSFVFLIPGPQEKKCMQRLKTTIIDNVDIVGNEYKLTNYKIKLCDQLQCTRHCTVSSHDALRLQIHKLLTLYTSPKSLTTADPLSTYFFPFFFFLLNFCFQDAKPARCLFHSQ